CNRPPARVSACRSGGRAIRRLVGKERSRRRPKRSEKLQKTALFDSSNRFTSARQGCQRFARSAKGTRTGEIPCCGSGPEPVVGLFGFFWFLSLPFSPPQMSPPPRPPPPTSSSTQFPAPSCIPPLRPPAGIPPLSPRS